MATTIALSIAVRGERKPWATCTLPSGDALTWPRTCMLDREETDKQEIVVPDFQEHGTYVNSSHTGITPHTCCVPVSTAGSETQPKHELM